MTIRASLDPSSINSAAMSGSPEPSRYSAITASSVGKKVKIGTWVPNPKGPGFAPYVIPSLCQAIPNPAASCAPLNCKQGSNAWLYSALPSASVWMMFSVRAHTTNRDACCRDGEASRR